MIFTIKSFYIISVYLVYRFSCGFQNAGADGAKQNPGDCIERRCTSQNLPEFKTNFCNSFILCLEFAIASYFVSTIAIVSYLTVFAL